jgi:hypothetical protein
MVAQEKFVSLIVAKARSVPVNHRHRLPLEVDHLGVEVEDEAANQREFIFCNFERCELQSKASISIKFICTPEEETVLIRAAESCREDGRPIRNRGSFRHIDELCCVE